MKRIIAAIDSSPAAIPVIETTKRLAAALDADVEALHVLEDDCPAPRSLADAAHVRLRTETGEPVATIIAALEEDDVALAVIGARSRPGGARPAGHTALAVVQRVSKPVVVVPPEFRPPSTPLRRLLVPLDGTTEVAAAVDQVVASLAGNGVEVVAAHVFAAATIPRFWDQPQHEANSWGQEFLARYCSHPGARIILRAGPPEVVVPEVASEEHADLVVIAWGQSMGEGHARTVREVLACVSVPVLLLPVAVVTIDRRRHDAVLFDLDGVVTDTASVHAAAWKRLFDDYLAGRAERAGEEHRPFSDEDYRRHVDGRSRYDGVAAFLVSRGISLPRGAQRDGEGIETVCGLGNRKDRYFHERLAADGVEVFESTVALVRRLQRSGIATAVFSASRNCREVLEAAELGDLFPVRVDGVVADDLHLAGKPDPAMLLEAARRLGVDPARTVVVEDAEAGVEAGRRGGFALVIGVDRFGRPGRLADRGAHVVVADLAQVAVDARP